MGNSIGGMVTIRRLPHHTQANGSIVCRHRDVSCCGECARHPYVVDVVGSHFYVEDIRERAELKRMVVEMAS